MNLKKLLASLDAFPVLDHTNESWLYVETIMALYSDLFGDYLYSSDSLEGFAELHNLTIHTPVDFEHQSDESCYIKVVSYKSVPFGLVHKFGDRCSVEYTVLDKAVFLEVGKLVSAFRLEQRLNEIEESMGETPSGLSALSGLSNQYMTWVSDEIGLFSMDSPGWMYGFTRMLDDHVAVLQREDGSIHKVVSIKPFTGTGSGTRETRELFDVMTDNGQTQAVNGKNLMFFLVRPDNPVEAALSAVYRKTEWKFDRTVQVGDQWLLRCVQYQEGRLTWKRVSAILPNPASKDVMNAFVSKHHVGRHEGVFVASEHGFEAVAQWS
jgi:hypothetical protein